MWLCQVQEEELKLWILKNVEIEPWQWIGEDTFAIDSRYIDTLTEGIEDAGFEADTFEIWMA